MRVIYHMSGRAFQSEVLGFLMGAAASGALVGAIYLASRKSVLGLGGLIAAVAGFFGLALIAFSYSHHLWLSLLIVPLAGFTMLITFASANTVLQTLTDDEKRGRVMSFFTMAFVGMTPWGNLLAGSTADALVSNNPVAAWAKFDGAASTLRIAGTICIIGAISFAIKLPAMRRLARPVYMEKGILPRAVATGLQDATEVVSGHEQQ